MANIKIDNSKTVGKIKPLHAVGQPPVGGLGKKYFQHFHFLTEAGIPYSRLHDVAGAFGGNRFVDIPNIFRDFDADENDPASYDFTFTDALITALVEAGCEPYYRLGVTIENQAEIKSYYLDPPKDYDKWAAICEHIVAHYTDGWADGFYYDIKYWEVWGEPDDGMRVSQLWNGTPEEYYRLYEVTSKRLKARFSDIKIGAYGATTIQAAFYSEAEREKHPRMVYMLDFFKGFVDYVNERRCPLDFFSWHCYSSPENLFRYNAWIEDYLNCHGLGDIEIHLNEFNPHASKRCTGEHSAEVAAIILALQNTKTSMCNFYDARLGGSEYAGLFHPMTSTPTQTYYALVAFNELYKLGDQVEVDINADTKLLFAVAATDGEKKAIVISNISGRPQELDFEGVDLSCARYHVIDDQRLLSWSPEVKVINNNTVLLIEY